MVSTRRRERESALIPARVCRRGREARARAERSTPPLASPTPSIYTSSSPRSADSNASTCLPPAPSPPLPPAPAPAPASAPAPPAPLSLPPVAAPAPAPAPPAAPLSPPLRSAAEEGEGGVCVWKRHPTRWRAVREEARAREAAESSEGGRG
eukprot:2454114-Rhodomonas_salina.1